MAIKKIHEEKNGVIGYVITKEEDLEKLPKNGIAITSRAILVNPTIGVKTYIFYDNDVDKNTDGEWIEWKAKYSGLGDNVKDYIKEYHEDLNKIVDVTNPKIDEGYDVTINDSEEGVLNFEVNGRTLQNLVNADAFYKTDYWNRKGTNFNLVDGYVSVEANGRYQDFELSKTSVLLKSNTVYSIVVDIKENTLVDKNGSSQADLVYFLDTSNTVIKTNSNMNIGKKTGIFVVKVTTVDDINTPEKGIFSFVNDLATSGNLKIRYSIFEGDYTNTPIETLPFVEGIQSVGENEVQEDGKYLISVKSFGKNLLNYRKWSKTGEATIIDNNDGSFTLTTTSSWSGIAFKDIILKSNTTYTVKYKSSQSNIGVYVRIKQKDGSYNTPANWGWKSPLTFTTSVNTPIVQVSVETKIALDNVVISDIQLEENTVATTYEPYQESTYNCLLDEPLRQLPNGVCDTIEKDKVVRRVGKVVLDGSEEYTMSDNLSYKGGAITKRFALRIPMSSNPFICDKLKCVDFEDIYNGSSSYDTVAYYVREEVSAIIIGKGDFSTIDELKSWLASNNVTVYYALATPTEEQLPIIPTINSYDEVTHIYSTNYIQPFIEIFDTVSIFKDANQYLNIECDRVFALPNMDDLEDNAVKEIHMYIYMKEEATLTFPSDIKWETLSEFGKGDYVEIILTYVKTNGVGQWLGSAIVYNG